MNIFLNTNVPRILCFSYMALLLNIHYGISMEPHLLEKIVEINNNNHFVEAANNPEFEGIRSAWSELGEASEKQIENAHNCSKKSLSIAGIELEAYDITTFSYQFHIHTTALTRQKAALIKQYVLSSRNDGDHRFPVHQLNLDLCPLLSTSVIDPFTGGYTENCCNFGEELQIHLIIKADPRAITHMGPQDIYSPASHRIGKFLNNTEGHTTMVTYFTKNLNTLQAPRDLVQKTHGMYDFNEVVVLGNMYTRFFKDSKDIEILGIGISSYWIECRKTPNPDDIHALKELSEILPIVYYEPKSMPQSGLFYDIMLGYLPCEQWVSKLRQLIRNKLLPPMDSCDDYMMGYNIGLSSALPFVSICLCRAEGEKIFSEYEKFRSAYNQFISYIHDDSTLYNVDRTYNLLKEVLLSNGALALGVTRITEEYRTDIIKFLTEISQERELLYNGLNLFGMPRH